MSSTLSGNEVAPWPPAGRELLTPFGHNTAVRRRTTLWRPRASLPRCVCSRGGPLRRAPTVAAGQVRAMCHCSVAHPPSPSYSCTVLLQARVVGAVHAEAHAEGADGGGGAAGTGDSLAIPLTSGRCVARLIAVFHSCLPAALQDRAPGAVYNVQMGALRRAPAPGGVAGTQPLGQHVCVHGVFAHIPSLLARASLASLQTGPAEDDGGGRAAGTCCSLQTPSPLLSLCVWLYAHLPTLLQERVPGAACTDACPRSPSRGTRAGRCVSVLLQCPARRPSRVYVLPALTSSFSHSCPPAACFDTYWQT
jgi:hypothetical protein